ncbi:MAG: EamA family transporter RarD [Pirellulaceae bacterium]
MQSNATTIRSGLLAAVAAHVLWGVFPIFWKQLDGFDALQTVCHRVIWSFLFLLPIAVPWLRSNLRAAPLGTQAFRDKPQTSAPYKWPQILAGCAVAAFFIGLNWLIFIWAVNHDRVLQTSLGYYINPLLNVLLGVLFLGERLTRLQWSAVGLATLGVAVMTYSLGGLPWVSLALAGCFALYGFVKKQSPLPALVGLWFEMLVLIVPAVAYLVFAELTQGGAFTSGNLRLNFWLLLGGTVTIAPLGFFAYAAQRVPLSLLGVLQYIGPTMQFLTGVFLFGERVGVMEMFGFLLVWAACLIYLKSIGQEVARERVNVSPRPSDGLTPSSVMQERIAAADIRSDDLLPMDHDRLQNTLAASDQSADEPST